jgi:hypothetical protein
MTALSQAIPSTKCLNWPTRDGDRGLNEDQRSKHPAIDFPQTASKALPPRAWGDRRASASVLEALSAPNRERAGRGELWLRARTATRTMGATEWQREPIRPNAVRVITSATITQCLQRYARWLNLPSFEGKARQLTAREGRKTFARFAALLDRRCLYALAQHLGHRDRSLTDSGYAGTDYALEREIRTEVLERSVAAWVHSLGAHAEYPATRWSRRP